jgi:hypothetical protein
LTRIAPNESHALQPPGIQNNWLQKEHAGSLHDRGPINWRVGIVFHQGTVVESGQ